MRCFHESSPKPLDERHVMRYPTRLYCGSSVRVELDIILTVTFWDRTVEGECSLMAPLAFDVGDLISSGVVLPNT